MDSLEKRGIIRQQPDSIRPEGLGDLMPSGEGTVEGLPAEKHAWLTKVGLLAREFIRDNRSEIRGNMVTNPVCQAHAFCTEALLDMLGVKSEVHMHVEFIPKHFFNYIGGDEAILDSYPEGTGATTTGNEVNVGLRSSKVGGRYAIGFRLIDRDDGPSLLARRETYAPLIGRIRGLLASHPPDLEELKRSNPYRSG